MLSRRLSNLMFRFSKSKQLIQMNATEKMQYLQLLEDNSFVQYKKYPYLPHQDPSSPQYVYSQLDQYHDEVEVKQYNRIINEFKHDIQLQRKVWDSISNLDRPYKRGIPGIDTNLNPNGPTQPKLADLGFPRREDQDGFTGTEYFTLNQDRFIGNTQFHQKHNFKHIQQWQQERRNRPVNKNFNHKGYKYDVQTKQEEKYQYLADRLGHPQFLGTPIQRLLNLEADIYHPTYLDQPFVKMPSFKPHPSLNFQQGEVIYENTKILEWIKFWQLSGITLTAFLAIFVPYNMVFKTNLVTDKADQFVFKQLSYVTPGNVDILHLGVPLIAGVLGYAVYILTNSANRYLNDYIVKMSYSKDKELIFIKRVDMYGRIQQQVYQTAHLQILPPTNKSGVGQMSIQDDDGLWKVTSMNNQQTFYLYNEPLHWNQLLKDQFIYNRLGLWDKSYYGHNRPEAEAKQQQWRQQIKDTLNRASLPKNL